MTKKKKSCTKFHYIISNVQQCNKNFSKQVPLLSHKNQYIKFSFRLKKICLFPVTVPKNILGLIHPGVIFIVYNQHGCKHFLFLHLKSFSPLIVVSKILYTFPQTCHMSITQFLDKKLQNLKSHCFKCIGSFPGTFKKVKQQNPCIYISKTSMSKSEQKEHVSE